MHYLLKQTVNSNNSIVLFQQMAPVKLTHIPFYFQIWMKIILNKSKYESKTRKKLLCKSTETNLLSGEYINKKHLSVRIEAKHITKKRTKKREK